jgi:IS1 family transposase
MTEKGRSEMSILMWVAAAWLAVTTTMIVIFYGARYSRHLASLIFGLPDSSNVHRLEPVHDSREQEMLTRIAA